MVNLVYARGAIRLRVPIILMLINVLTDAWMTIWDMSEFTYLELAVDLLMRTRNGKRMQIVALSGALAQGYKGSSNRMELSSWLF